MPRSLSHIAAILGLAILPACEDGGRDQDVIAGALVGAAAGWVTAEVLEADDDWQIVAVLAGAAAGTLAARHRRNNRCAYSRGNGTYYLSSCPR